MCYETACVKQLYVVQFSSVLQKGEGRQQAWISSIKYPDTHAAKLIYGLHNNV